MFNKNLFRAKIVEHGLTLRAVAEILGMTEPTLHRKMKGESEFTRNEIQLFREKLGLSIEEVEAIFFT